tara:strand:+ start:530 stop:898 length:369 start_codon:yes stop_codon:yes gene_type:complete
MRKITQEALRAFDKGKKFKKSNTEVKIIKSMDKIVRVELLLHGNVIAYQNWTYFKNTVASSFGDMKVSKDLWITAAGWRTNTTKERLNGLNGVNIYQKDFQWHLNGEAWNGEPKYISTQNYW